MLDATADIASILDDCGQAADTKNGPLLGRFVEEPIEVETLSGHTALSSEPIFYAEQSEIAALDLVRDDWLDLSGRRWHIREIPRPDTTGVVRVVLKK